MRAQRTAESLGSRVQSRQSPVSLGGHRRRISEGTTAPVVFNAQRHGTIDHRVRRPMVVGVGDEIAVPLELVARFAWRGD